MGGEFTLGHPQVFIRVDTKVPGKVATCKYCGLKFKKKQHDH